MKESIITPLDFEQELTRRAILGSIPRGGAVPDLVDAGLMIGALGAAVWVAPKVRAMTDAEAGALLMNLLRGDGVEMPHLV